jgi:hypothetical protein
VYNRAQIFRDVYQGGLWGSNESASGNGSEMEMTTAIRASLPALFHDYEIKSLLDAPCGDFNWMKTVALPTYIGMDIVPELIASNLNQYPGIDFRVGDIILDTLPTVDMVLCRDGLNHLSFDDVMKAIQNFRRSAKYLALTTYPHCTDIWDIEADLPPYGWRPINLELPPFSLGHPLRTIVEGSEPLKCLGVWAA